MDIMGSEGGKGSVVDGMVNAREKSILVLMGKRGEVVGIEGGDGTTEGSAKILVVLAGGDRTRDNIINFYVIVFPPVRAKEKDVEKEGIDEGASGRVRDDGD
ncbi:hypothetical protein CBR_g30082 [Chara braunii]|uniref:Uncharacterized protein n=1 Tax=Chara braunii TaxID=69332 RepID=A0A388LBY8_CHABU|nr:hypothetical protein CBR_g30082 [Chara braunii]|eukprot:GBG79818.1 hypothetical protein CBR_g30082 [Chara braunii]